MTVADLAKRVDVLEQEIGRLKVQLATNGQSPGPASPTGHTGRHWWHDAAGSFADDPEFEEMARLGREYRESLHPDSETKSGDKNKQARKPRNARA